MNPKFYNFNDLNFMYRKEWMKIIEKSSNRNNSFLPEEKKEEKKKGVLIHTIVYCNVPTIYC